MYKTKCMYGYGELTRFIADTINENNFEIITVTQSGEWYTIIYKTI